MVLVSAILFLLAREGDTGFAYVGLIPAVVFWGLDGQPVARTATPVIAWCLR